MERHSTRFDRYEEVAQLTVSRGRQKQCNDIPSSGFEFINEGRISFLHRLVPFRVRSTGVVCPIIFCIPLHMQLKSLRGRERGISNAECHSVSVKIRSRVFKRN